MKNKLRYLILSYVLLAVFATGQLVAYFHQHPDQCNTALSAGFKKNAPQKSFDYKCSICHVLDQTHMVLFHTDQISQEVALQRSYCDFYLKSQDVKLISSSGRDPPRA